MSTFSFSIALAALKNGDKVQRAGWNGKNMWVKAQFPDDGSLMSQPYLYLRTAQGDNIPWTVSQADVFAEDWSIVE